MTRATTSKRRLSPRAIHGLQLYSALGHAGLVWACHYAMPDAAYVNTSPVRSPGGGSIALRIGSGSLERSSAMLGGLELGGRAEWVSQVDQVPLFYAGPSLLVAPRLSRNSNWALAGRTGLMLGSAHVSQQWLIPELNLGALRTIGERNALTFGLLGQWRLSPEHSVPRTTIWGIYVGYGFGVERASSHRSQARPDGG